VGSAAPGIRFAFLGRFALAEARATEGTVATAELSDRETTELVWDLGNELYLLLVLGRLSVT